MSEEKESGPVEQFFRKLGVAYKSLSEEEKAILKIIIPLAPNLSEEVFQSWEKRKS